MDISAALRADLAALSDALDDGVDLEAELHALIDDVKLAVSSCVGMTMTLVSGAHEVSFTVREDPDDREIATSLQIPLGRDSGPNAGSHLVLYAAVAGAFVDLAADLSYALALTPAALLLDRHLTALDHNTGVDGLAGHSAINLAIGALIDRGHTPDSAREELHRLAATGGVSVPAAADRLLDTMIRRPPGGDQGRS